MYNTKKNKVILPLPPPFIVLVKWFVKCLFGYGTINDFSICWFSDKFFDIHDYKKHKGGDGTPDHEKVYKCPNCGKMFKI